MFHFGAATDTLSGPEGTQQWLLVSGKACSGFWERLNRLKWHNMNRKISDMFLRSSFSHGSHIRLVVAYLTHQVELGCYVEPHRKGLITCLGTCFLGTLTQDKIQESIADMRWRAGWSTAEEACWTGWNWPCITQVMLNWGKRNGNKLHRFHIWCCGLKAG